MKEFNGVCLWHEIALLNHFTGQDIPGIPGSQVCVVGELGAHRVRNNSLVSTNRKLGPNLDSSKQQGPGKSPRGGCDS